MNFSEQTLRIQQYCKDNLSEARYEHSKRVYETAREINQKLELGIKEEFLLLVAYAHDIARELPGEVCELIATWGREGIEPWEKQYKLFCHNKAGIVLLRELFDVQIPEVLEAVKHHTLGSAGLSPLAKVLYISDFLEPKRPFLKEEERKAYFQLSLDEIVYEVSMRTVFFLRENQKPILAPTQAMLRELAQKLGRESELKQANILSKAKDE